MTVFTHYIRRLIRKPLTLALTAVVPVLIVLIVGSAGSGARIRAAVIDRDGTALSAMVIDAARQAAVLIEIGYDEIEDALVEGRIEYALALPAGLQERVAAGRQAEVDEFSLRGVGMTRAVRSAADAVLSAAHNLARSTGGDLAAFERGMAGLREGTFALAFEAYGEPTRALAAGQAEGLAQLLGMLTLTMFFSSLGASLMFLKDIETGSYRRTLAGPISAPRYTMEASLAFFGAVALQALAAGLALRLSFPAMDARILSAVSAVLLCFALVAVSFTQALANAFRTTKRTAVATNFLVMPMAMLGGAFWPFDIMPDYLRRVGSFTPTRWASLAAADALSGAGPAEMAPKLGVLLLFALVFQLLGAWRRVDVAAPAG